MQEFYGQSRGPLIALHGGAGGMDPRHTLALQSATEALTKIASKGISALREGQDALDVVVLCLKELELDEQFNAGKGSALQADAQARLTAAIMDGDRQSFSGVICASYINHPSVLARHLQEESSRVLTNPGAELLARRLSLPIASNLSPERVQQWAKRAHSGERFCDTVGVIVLTGTGRLCAGTSTGGRGYEFPGRVSDSATVAGTYCSAVAGISATGVGEEIVDDAVAARLETRRRDGLSLEEASRLCFQEALKRKRAYGWIALDQSGSWATVHTTPAMSYVVAGQEGVLSVASF